MVETEIKLKITDCWAFIKKLESLGLHEVEKRKETNSLYDDEKGTLAAKGEILRLRSYGDEIILTHKAKTTGTDYLQRVETEAVVAPNMFLILEALGYKSVFTYGRERTIFRYPSNKLSGEVVIDRFISIYHGTVKTDNIPPYGTYYVELEGWDGWINMLTSMLGFTKDQYIKKSYQEIFS